MEHESQQSEGKSPGSFAQGSGFPNRHGKGRKSVETESEDDVPAQMQHLGPAPGVCELIQPVWNHAQ